MLFPRTIFTKNTIYAQLAHLESELNEVIDAVLAQEKLPESERNYDHTADELVDLMHSADTMLRILQERYNADSLGAFSRVNINNTRRGYYGEVKHETV